MVFKTFVGTLFCVYIKYLHYSNIMDYQYKMKFHPNILFGFLFYFMSGL